MIYVGSVVVSALGTLVIVARDKNPYALGFVFSKS